MDVYLLVSDLRFRAFWKVVGEAYNDFAGNLVIVIEDESNVSRRNGLSMKS